MFNPDYLRSFHLEKYNRIVIAFSGGLDSTVLLQSLISIPELKKKILAIHVNHGISPNSHAWSKHCGQVCSSVEIEITLGSKISKLNG